jgi:hypothetical protein
VPRQDQANEKLSDDWAAETNRFGWLSKKLGLKFRKKMSTNLTSKTNRTSFIRSPDMMQTTCDQVTSQESE